MAEPCERCKQLGCSFTCMKAQRDEALEAVGTLMGAGGYPRGQISADDQGEIAIAITTTNGTLVVNFRQPLSWFGLGYKEAVVFAELLLKRAEDIKQ